MSVAAGHPTPQAVGYAACWIAGVILGCTVASDKHARFGIALVAVPVAIIAIAEGTTSFVLPSLPLIGDTISYANVINSRGAVRAASTFGQPLIAGSCLALLALYLGEGSRRWQRSAGALLVSGALATISRSAVLVVAAGSSVMVVQQWRRPLRAILAVVAIAVLALAMYTQAPQFRASVASRTTQSYEQVVRRYAIAKAQTDFDARPASLLIGRGVGQSSRDIAAAGSIAGFTIYDNQYVTALYDFGIILVVLVAVAFAWAIARADPAHRRAGLPIVVGGLVAIGFTDGLYWQSLSTIVFLGLGLASAPAAKSIRIPPGEHSAP